MIRELRNAEICLYIHEYIFIYDLYKSNNKNYDMTLEDIEIIINDNKIRNTFHKILLDVIGIDNYKDGIINNITRKNIIKISLDNNIYSKNIVNIYKKFINNSITYNILNEILNKTLIFQIKIGNNYKNLIKFDEVHLSLNEIVRIIENDYTNDICMICLENIKDVDTFMIFNCCFSKICNECYKANNYKCPICNQKTRTLISF